MSSEVGFRQPLPPAVADMMLGRLATWLRIVGADVAYGTEVSDDDLVDIAARDGRLVLTRDRGIMERESSVDRYFIRHDRVDDQLRQVARDYDLSGFEPFSRCLRCNERLRAVDKEAVRDRLWPYVYATQDRIVTCPSCGRLYWGGTHPARALGRLREMLGPDAPA